MNGKRKRREGAVVWGERVVSQSHSGLSVEQYCKREGLGTGSFYRWRARLRREAGGDIQEVRRGPQKEHWRDSAGEMPSTGTGGFIDLGSLPVAKGEPPRDLTGWAIRLELGGGVVLHLERH